ncbi:MAG: hypothetical protein ABFE01_17690 [Phycisphaerales bacterium]
MSKQSDSPITMTTGEAIEAFRRVKISGSTVVYADAGEVGIGVGEAYAASGAALAIRTWCQGGTFKGVAAGAFSAGATIYGAADGKVDDTVVGSPIAYAIEAATADGDVVELVECKGETDSSALANSGVSERSRAATAMPTEAIWSNFNLTGMRSHPFSGSLLDCDFTHGEHPPEARFADTSSVINVLPGTAGEGILTIFATADNEAAEVQWTGCPITVSGGAAWALEARVKASQIANTKGGWFLGLMVAAAAPSGDLIVDAGTLQTEGSIGFQNKEGDGDILDLVYDTTGQAQNEHDDDYVTLVADTYNVLGLYCNGTTIQGYVDGVLTGTAISAADIAAADFPAGLIMVPTFCLKNAAADDVTITLDWIRVAQLAA